MQYHGVADRYTLDGAARLRRCTPTRRLRRPSRRDAPPVGSNGGQAAAFAFDLARSIVYTRQGNPAWSGQERDGIPPIRSDDLFFGGAQADWVNLDKVAIPQADEQQRLLANLILHMNARSEAVAEVLVLPAGRKGGRRDDGRRSRQQRHGRPIRPLQDQQPGQLQRERLGVRPRNVVYLSGHAHLPTRQAAAYVADGFEIGRPHHDRLLRLHAQSLQTNYARRSGRCSRVCSRACRRRDQPDALHRLQRLRHAAASRRWRTAFGSTRTTTTGPAHGCEPSGVHDRLRHADAVRQGSTARMIDVYQAATQMTDESEQTLPFTIDTLLDRAHRPEGYYGFFVANMHTDTVAHAGSEAIVASAHARGRSVISAAAAARPGWMEETDPRSAALNWNGPSGVHGTWAPGRLASKHAAGVARHRDPASSLEERRPGQLSAGNNQRSRRTHLRRGAGTVSWPTTGRTRLRRISASCRDSGGDFGDDRPGRPTKRQPHASTTARLRTR